MFKIWRKKTFNHKFCNRSCSAIYNNKHRVIKIKEYHCSLYGELIGKGHKYYRCKFCDNCNPQKIDWFKVSLGDVKEKRGHQQHSRIRTLAQNKVKNLKYFQQCSNCNYSKHIEICHIKVIKDHDDITTVESINSLNNLVGLWPNCHWEFDNNLLDFNPKWIEDNLPL